MDHVGIVVDDLAAAKAFFEELGLELQGEASVEGGSSTNRGKDATRGQADLLDGRLA
jgi:catechol 2,3-dioxygenase-like lactoylglutathione lyase family enzyme